MTTLQRVFTATIRALQDPTNLAAFIIVCYIVVGVVLAGTGPKRYKQR